MSLSTSGGSEASNPLPSVAKFVDNGNADDSDADDDENDVFTRRRTSCAPPSKVNGSLVYRGDSNEPIADVYAGHHQVRVD